MWEGGINSSPYGWRRTREIGLARIALRDMEKMEAEISFSSIKEKFPGLSPREISQALNINKNGTPI